MRLFKIIQNRKFIFLYVCLFICIIASKFNLSIIAEAFWIFSWTCIICFWINKTCFDKWLKALFLIGYVLRLGFTLYSNAFIPLENDAVSIFNDAASLLNGNFFKPGYNYSYFVYLQFLIFGPSRLLATFTNTLLWFGVVVMSSKILKDSDTYSKVLAYLLLCLYPSGIFWSCSLLRESTMGFFFMLTLVFLRKYVLESDKKSIVFACISAFPAVWLHTGSIAMYGAIGFVLLFWNVKEKKWNFSIVTILSIIVAMISFVVLWNYFTPHVRYLPSKFTLETITSYHGAGVGNTDYLDFNEKISTFGQFFKLICYRVFMFWNSPFGKLWKNPIMIGVFFVTAVPMAVITVDIAIHFVKERSSIIGTCLVGLFCFTIIYAWGTNNAGTALRHRDMLYPFFVMALSDCKKKA